MQIMAKNKLIADDRNISTSVSMTLEAERFSAKTCKDGRSAYEGMICAENIRPTLANAISAPRGVRFVMRLPVQSPS
jgi:hypothetical protein